MKIKKYKIAAMALMPLCALMLAPGAFADSPYGMVYSGGVELSESNVQVNPSLINGLTLLFGPSNNNTTTYSNSNLWQEGYHKTSETECLKTKYLKIDKNGLTNAGNDLYYTKTNSNYTLVFQVKEILVDSDFATTMGDDKFAEVDFGSRESSATVRAGQQFYTDSECTNAVPNLQYLNSANPGKFYLRANVALYRKNENVPLKSDQLYYQLEDIDATQSFKIMNADNKLSKNNMFTKSAEGLQPEEGTLKNMYVANDYIYSQQHMALSNSNIYVKLGQSAQESGLDIVYGFGVAAASNIRYYAKQYVVNYTSDEGGDITGIKTENVLSGNNPSGTNVVAKDSYELKNWVADKDVTVADGTVIKASNPISAEQLKLAVIESDITFIAIHQPVKSDVAVPNTGASTSQNSAIVVPVSIAGVIVCAMMLGLLPKVFHKRVSFKK